MKQVGDLSIVAERNRKTERSVLIQAALLCGSDICVMIIYLGVHYTGIGDQRFGTLLNNHIWMMGCASNSLVYLCLNKYAFFIVTFYFFNLAISYRTIKNQAKGMVVYCLNKKVIPRSIS